MKNSSLCNCENPQNDTICIKCDQQSDQPIYNYQDSVNNGKRSTTSLTLSIIAVGLAFILLVPSCFAGGLTMSCASQPPSASVIDLNDDEALRNYQRESAILGALGLAIMFAPPMSSIILSIIAVVLGKKANKYSRKHGVKAKGAIAGIVLSSIVLCWAAIAFSLILFAYAFYL